MLLDTLLIAGVHSLPKKESKDSKKSKKIQTDDISVYTSKLFELNLMAQDAVKEFALHDIDNRESLDAKRIAMHDAYTDLYNEVAEFSERSMGEDFDIAYLRDRIAQSDGEMKAQLEEAMNELEALAKQNLADVWMAKVLAWLHQAAAASGPFVEDEDEVKQRSASRELAKVYTMLEKPFSAVSTKVDGTQKLRRVALGHKAYSLISDITEVDSKELALILGKNKAAEAEFFDEFLNELIGQESTFRQAFNPFDELIWRDILSSFIFEQATDLYNEAIPHFKKSKSFGKEKLATINSWKHNTAGLSEVYLAMTYNDIAGAQMRAGNLGDASKLFQVSSDAFGRAEKLFDKVVSLQSNAEQSRNDKEQNKAQSFFCRAESNVKILSDLLAVNNKKESFVILADIFKDLRGAEKLAKSRELTGAIKENLRIFSFIEGLLKKKKTGDISTIAEQIEFAKDLRKTGLVQDVSKSLDSANAQVGENPSDALDAIREGLDSLGILLSLESEDEEVGILRNRTLALLNNVKYVIQFQLSSQLQQGVKFIMSRILENLHAEEAASYYKVIGDTVLAEELTDLGKLALATAYASEAQVFSRQSEQWAFRAQVERSAAFQRLEDDLAQFDDEDTVEKALGAHDETIMRIGQSVAAFEAAANELNSVKGEVIRTKNNVDGQVKQLHGVVMKFRGDLSRLQGAKSDFMAEFLAKKGDNSKATRFYSDASDQLREAVGNYNVAAQVFQQIGDTQAAQSVDSKAKTTDLLARSVWDNRQRLSRDQEPAYKGDPELIALYLGGGGS
ncbi:MAG: hypothetical protein ACW97A_02640 [Candidatus Thorarchaeota archaeon]